MISDIGRRPEQGGLDRQYGTWRTVVSAWGLALLFMIMLAAVETAECHGSRSPSVGRFAGVVIPQHDPCVGPGIPSAANVDGCASAPLRQRHDH